VLDHERGELKSDQCTAEEANEAERPDQEALPVAIHGKHDDQDDQDEIDNASEHAARVR
jgi:hypothetical protein